MAGCPFPSYTSTQPFFLMQLAVFLYAIIYAITVGAHGSCLNLYVRMG